MEDVFGSVLQCPAFPKIVLLDSSTAYCILLFFQALYFMDLSKTF